MHINDLLAHDATVVKSSIDIISRVRADDLGRATPCAEWTLGDLLAHMTVQHRGFAAAARGNGDDHAVWEVRPVGPDPVREYTEAAEDLLTAFAEPGVAEREFVLPEFGSGARFPAAQALSFHLVDYVVHNWDVARSLGIDYDVPAEVSAAALPIALSVPDGEGRLQPGSPFKPAVAEGEHADPLRRILAALGRSPGWER